MASDFLKYHDDKTELVLPSNQKWLVKLVILSRQKVKMKGSHLPVLETPVYTLTVHCTFIEKNPC